MICALARLACAALLDCADVCGERRSLVFLARHRWPYLTRLSGTGSAMRSLGLAVCWRR
jgi:hypothetical protein